MREIILKSFPLQYRRYIEVFGGGASILFAKQKEKFEVYNDFNGDLVNMFRCIKERPLALLKTLKFFPLHSRQDFNIDFDDGRKVVCSAYSSKNYLGMKDIEMGSRVEVSFAPNTNGKVQLTAIAVVE